MCALGAGLLWGLVFVAPLMLRDYPGMVLSFGRYIAFGLIALVPAWFDRSSMRRLYAGRLDRCALKLAPSATCCITRCWPAPSSWPARRCRPC